MSEFQKVENKRTLKIKETYELINKLEQALTEEKSTQFYDQKKTQIESLWHSIIQNTEKMMGETEYSNKHMEELETLRNMYDNVIITVEERRAKIEAKRKIELPRLEIPEFDGNYLTWKSFHDLFERTVYSEKTISNVEKFQLLRTVLKGEASQIINHLQITEANFEAAWKLLKHRFNNERRLIETYVKNILNQEYIATETAESVRKLHDTTMECILAIKNMKIETSTADFLLNVIIAQKLHTKTIQQYENTIKNPKQIQKFDDLMKFLEERFHTLETIESAEAAECQYE